LDDVARFAQSAGVTVSVVFDGAPEKHFADGASYRGVRVFYAKRGSNADERIKDFVEEARERRTLLVVTSDRALADYVRRCGAQVIRSGEFRQRIDEVARAAAQQDSIEPSVNEGLGEWMRYFGVDDDE
jgi:predicted RNA-binding protein with PIN domain